MLVLGVETSCDETGIALYDSERGLLAHALHSQIELHNQYGGVVPELASRDHIRKILPLIKQVLSEAGKDRKELDGIAYTAGPGLIGAVIVGATVAKSLAMSLGIPAVGVHHMEGHLLAPMLEDDKPSYPFLALLVSGAHTQIVEVTALGEYKILGESIDDAAGEAFDKTAKLLGLGYPGGAVLSKLAEQGQPNRFQFPRPMVNRPGLDFSFSGLKTAALNAINELGDVSEQDKADIAVAFQEAVVDTLAIKCKRAIEQTGLNQLVIAGGVSANTLLREKLAGLMEKFSGKVFYPRHEFCTDNGAMIAYAGYLRLQQGQTDGLSIDVKARWDMSNLGTDI